MAASAVDSLIALSDTICNPLLNSSPVGHGNFFGPWLTDTKWSPKRSPADSTVTAPKKKATPRGIQTSKSLPRRLSLFTSLNINSSPYGAQRCKSPTDDNFASKCKLKFITRSRSLVASDGNKRQLKARTDCRKESKMSIKNQRVDEEDEEGEDDEIREGENGKGTGKHYQFQNPALPALITLTSNTNDAKSTFALGRQLEIPLPKVYVSVGQNQSARTKPRANSASLPLFSGKEQGSNINMADRQVIGQNDHGQALSYISTGRDRDVSQCRAEALKRALEMRNPPAPTHEHEDISQHMRHYRIYCTVLGTGRFSLANELEKRDVKPVQWQDLFPHRPLTAVGSVVDVPIFRFSVADFRVQTAPPTKGSRSTPPLLPRTATPRYLAPDDEVVRQEPATASHIIKMKDEESSDVSSDSNKKSEVDTFTSLAKEESKINNESVKREEKFAQSSKIANVTVCENKPTVNQQIADNSYMQFLRAKNKATKQPNMPQTASMNSNDIKRNERVEPKPEAKTVEKKRRLVAAEVSSDDEEDEYFRRKTKNKASKEPRLRKGSNFAAKKCEGQYGPTTRFFRSVTDLVSNGRIYTDIHPAGKLPASGLVVDANRLRESVEVKIHEGERKFRSSINDAVLSQIISTRNDKRLWQKINQRKPSILNGNCLEKSSTAFSLKPIQDNGLDGSSQNIADSNCLLDSCYDSVEENDDDEKNFDDGQKAKTFMKTDYKTENCATAKLLRKKNIGLVTSYDFRGYVEALRAKAERCLDGRNEFEDDCKMSDEDEVSPVSFVVNKKRNWRPKESRVRSAARGGKYRTRYPKLSEARSSKSRDSTGDDQDMYPRSSTSARLQYKPTSPATSAFVIAAPPNSNTTGIGGRSVVLPLEEFMEMAVEGKDQSFADWKTCLNNSSPGLMSRPQIGVGQKPRGDGLLKVVSFATPVNQFIFAKKITFDSTDSLGIFPFKNKKKKRLQEGRNELTENMGSSSRYRLKLSDFGLPRSFRQKTTSKEDRELTFRETHAMSDMTSNELPDSVKKSLEEPQHFRKDDLESESLNVNVPRWELLGELERERKAGGLTPKTDTLLMDNRSVIPISQNRKEAEPSTTGITKAFGANEKSKQAKNRSVSAEAHACLRKEILRLMEHRKSATARGKEDSDSQVSSAEGRKNWSGNTTLKEATDSKTAIDKGKEEISSTRTLTASSPDAAGAFTFRFNRQSSSLSPRRLAFKHRPRRLSERERSLSPSRIHKYFQKRRSTPEVRPDDKDLNLPPLTIQGGGISRPSSEKPEANGGEPSALVTKSENLNADSDLYEIENKLSTERTKNSMNEQEASVPNEGNTLAFLEIPSKTSVSDSSGPKINRNSGLTEELALCGVEESRVKLSKVRFSQDANRGLATETVDNGEDSSSKNILKKSHSSPKKATKYVRFSVDIL